MSSLEAKYKKEELQNHIYNTPDTYVGGCDLIIENLPLYKSESKRIEFRETEFSYIFPIKESKQLSPWFYILNNKLNIT